MLAVTAVGGAAGPLLPYHMDGLTREGEKKRRDLMVVGTMTQTSSCSVSQAVWLPGQATGLLTDVKSVSAAQGWNDAYVAALLFNIECNDSYVAAFLLNLGIGGRV
jgi:hypothetical protein